jgi:hypothetical protein
MTDAIKISDIMLNPQESEFIEKDVYLYKFPGNNCKVYKKVDEEIIYLGSTSGYTAIAHDGRSHGQLNLENDNNSIWISGFVIGYYLDGFLVRERE